MPEIPDRDGLRVRHTYGHISKADAREGTTEICGWMAVPPQRNELGEFVASLTTVNVPVDVPAVVGEKVILTVAVCPACRVAGRVTPLAVKPVPAAVICVTVTLPVPVFVSVAF